MVYESYPETLHLMQRRLYHWQGFCLQGFMYFHFPFEVCGRVQKAKYFIMSMNYSGTVLGVNITLNSSRSFISLSISQSFHSYADCTPHFFAEYNFDEVLSFGNL